MQAPEFNHFDQLDDEAFFKSFVTAHFVEGWGDITCFVSCELEVDPALIALAFTGYRQIIETFKRKLHSQNPDQYKRAGALLHALYKLCPVVGIRFDDKQLTELEEGTALGVSHDDAQYRLRLIEFYEEYHNQVLAFDLAFRCCQVHEPAAKRYPPVFLENVCHYLKHNIDLNVDSLSMIFRALMTSTAVGR